MAEVLLQGTFQQFPQCKCSYDVKLTRTDIVVDEIRESSFDVRPLHGWSVALRDVINVKVLETKFRYDSSVVFQVIQFVKGKQGKGRTRQDISFRVADGNGEENKLTAQLWSRTILWLLREPSLEARDLQAKTSYPCVRRYLALINPKSGKGKSVKVYKKSVEPILRLADVDYEEIVTDYAGQAHEIAKTLDLDKYDCILLCSGDGLGHEVVNGFMKRYDWEVAVKTPIAFIPTGSGNAIAISLAKAVGEEPDVISAVFIALRGRAVPLNICSFELCSRRIYGFLSCTWGLLADVDIESEKWRAIGSLRFTVGALSKIASLRKYKARIAYLPCESEGDFGDKQGTSHELGSAYLPLRANCSDESGRSTTDTWNATKDFGSSITNEGGAEGSPRESDSYKLASVHLNGEHNSASSPLEQHFTSVSYTMREQLDVLSTDRGPSNHLLPKDLSTLPTNWRTLSGNFVMALVTLVSDLGPGMPFVPGMPFGDDGMYLLYAGDDVTRKTMLGMFLALEEGEHLKYPELKVIKIKAFRLEPDYSHLGNLALDGEAVEYGFLQGQLHKGLGRIFSL